MAWKTTLLTAFVSILTAIITTKVTAWNSHRNEVKKWILDKRADVYFTFYNQAEVILKTKEKIFEQEYLDSLVSLKAKMNLVSSKKTFKAFHAYYEFIEATVYDYEKFCEQNDPLKVESRCHICLSEEGNFINYLDVMQSEIDSFDQKVKQYKNDNLPDDKLINEYIETLYKTMRNDFGSNI